MLPHNPDSLSETRAGYGFSIPLNINTSPHVLKLSRVSPQTTYDTCLLSHYVTPPHPSLYCACLLTHYVTPSLYCACLSENPFLTHLHSHLLLTSTAAANGSTLVSSPVLPRLTFVLPIMTVAHPPTSSLYHFPIPTNLPITTGAHTTLIFQTFLYSISRYVIGHVTLGWGIQPQITGSLLSVLR
jgi:hypothetical protein